MSRKLLCMCGLAALVVASGCSDDDDDPMDPVVEGPTSFTLTITNISSETPLAPGVWALTSSGTPIFDSGQSDRGDGLEALAEDGDNSTLAAALGTQAGVLSSGTFGSGGIGMGQSFTATFDAEEGQRLSFATMYVASNDLFFSPSMSGVSLFNGDEPISGDITSMIALLDGGTEVNEAPGAGENQPQTPSGPNAGPTEGLVQPVDDGYTYPANADVLSATLSSVTESSVTTFTVRIDNVSAGSDVLAPGAWAVHTGANPLFTSASPDAMLGLEELAEDGNNSVLVGNLPSMAQVEASGGFGAGPQGPGDDVYEFSFVAEDGQKLSFATMFVQSNDLFYAPLGDGMDLFSNGTPNGEGAAMDLTAMLGLWDAGTEINEEPGVGMNQAPRQTGANTGPTEGVVQVVSDGYSYGDVADVIEVTLTVN